jgi:hypothetical protein
VKCSGWAIVAFASCATLTVAPVHVRAAADAFGPTFQCPLASASYQAAVNAAVAGQDTQVVALAQQAIDAYDACKNKSTDDAIQQLGAIMMAAAFLPKDSKQKALYLYDRARIVLTDQCTAYPTLDLWAKAQIIAAAEQYHALAVPLGAVPAEPCEQRWPAPAPSASPQMPARPRDSRVEALAHAKH